ncbi:MAG: TonB-dependent receptor, partial [Prevotella sp.]|nr:TonB-dependent receptor [Prevotella sp.]
MKRLLSTLAILAVVTIAEAQKVSHTFRDVSMSEALRQLNEQSSDYTIHFLYNELEDFRVTTSFRNKRLPEAIQQMIGFYPIRMEIVTNQIFVECTHKAAHYLTGTIVDEQGQPVAYANVYLLSPSDSTVIGGGVSNEAGLFVIPCDEQDVMARISFVGYKTIYRRCKTSDLGTIRMQPDSYRLNGIEVKGARPLVRIKDDAFVTTVEGSYLSKMGTASEVLNHVPGVLSNGANVEVLGRGTPIIYINGRQMRNQSELGQLSSDQIKDIEVVMTPGAKYDASVRSVIRIKTIRPVGEGFSFSSKTMVGTNGHIIGQEEVNLNYRVGGLDIFSMADYEDFRMSATNTSRQDTYLRHHYMQHHVTSFCPHTNIYDGKLGFNYVFNDHHSLGMT